VGERVLLIEDDSRLADMVGEYLGKAGFHVIHAESGTRGLALHGREPLDVVILDLMLPDTDGLDICRQIRARSDTPILMLTARGDPMDRVVGLEMGADDYLPKPFEPRELLARCARSCAAAEPGPNPTCCATDGSRSTAAPAKCGLTACRVRSPVTNSRCCWRSPSMQAASCRVTR
jgi:DNA-binding response OmpR family regulator